MRVYDEKFLDLVVFKNVAGLLQGRPDRHRDEVVFGHECLDLFAVVGLETQVAVG